MARAGIVTRRGGATSVPATAGEGALFDTFFPLVKDQTIIG